MREKGNHAPLTTKIDIHDKQGRKIGEREVATYAGILALAHDDGLRSIVTKIVQAPTKDNGMVAIVTAAAKTNRGVFTGIGDADPSNVNSKIARHLLRMAETRAKARALRDAVNIGLVALEELGELVEDELAAQTAEPAQRIPPPPKAGPARQGRPANDNGTAPPAASSSDLPNPTEPEFRAMTEAQRALLFRIAGECGVAAADSEGWG